MNKVIEHYKELLQLLPRNNIKNSRTYMKKALQMKQTATAFKKDILNDIKRRYKLIVITKENEEINTLKTNLEDVSKNLYLLNDNNDSYEKSNLDEILFDIKKYYKSDLVKVNSDILNAINKFKEVGVNLTSKDFDYGHEVNTYMEVLFKENNPESNVLKQEFDKIYWKCPEIIEYININFRHLYFSNKKLFESFYDNKLKELNIKDKNQYLTDYNNNHSRYLLLVNSDIKTLQDSFMAGKLDVKEYDEAKIDKLKETLVTNTEESEGILKLSYTLYEYKNYLRFKDLIEEIKKIYQDKANKSLTKTILKNISKQESIIKKNNKKMNRKFFAPKNKDKFYSNIDKSLKELITLYDEYDEAKFKESVANKLNDSSTLLDLLKIASSYKINLKNIIKTLNEEADVDKEASTLAEFINYPNNTIINNINIIEEKDVVEIILDKYKLMGINITNEQLEETNLDSTINMINKILIGDYIKHSNLKYIDLNNIVEMKKILEKENIQI